MKKKRKVRRTVSVTPQHYLLLEALSLKLGMPMTRIVEGLLETLGAHNELYPMSHEAASAEILERVGNEDLRKSRERLAKEAREYAEARALARAAFG